MPTILDLIGIEPPEEIAGVAQRPLDGVSFAATLDDGGAPSAHVTQYYEMLGCRAIYHDGWKAAVFHPMLGFNYDGSDPTIPFDEQQWELFHVAEDPAETNDLAASHPEKLQELIDLWWAEAERNQVLPVNNQPGRFPDRRHRRRRYELHAGIGVLPAAVAPNVRNRGYRITAELDVPEGGAEGLIASHGGGAGGYALYVQDGRLRFTYNFLGATVTTVAAEEDLPTGQVTVGMSFTPTGRFQGEVVLLHDDLPVGKGPIARTTPITYGLTGFTVGYQRSTPVSPTYEAPFRFTDGALGKVVVETEGLEWRDPPAEERAGLAME